MYVSIDRDNLRFLHKHSDYMVVGDLASMEAPGVTVHITPTDTAFFLWDFTDLELRMLYRNTTGDDHNGTRSVLRALIADVADRLPVTDAERDEVEAQYLTLPQGSKEPFQYVRGAKKPARPAADLWAPESLRAASPVNIEAVVQALKTRVQAPIPAAAPAAPASGEKRPARPAAAPRTPGAPRQGGVREKIWEAADRMWEEAGKPTEKSAVLALRKRMMEHLETVGVKRTSSSNELGNWQKARLV